MTASPRDVAVNPNNQQQRYILWTNGRIDNLGGAPPIEGPGWYDRVDSVAMALHITDWTTGKGYVLDWQGGFTPLGGAPDLMTEEVQYPLPSVPGVEYVTYRKYIDWAWNPDGSGQGYVLDEWGQLHAFGGATAPPRTGPRWSTPAGRRLVMQWAPTKKAVTLDMHGGVHGDFGAPTVYAGRPYWPGRDYARDLAITDWTTAAGYVLDLYGTLHPFNGAPAGWGSPWQKADVARTLHVLSPSDPTRIWQVWSGGQQYEYVFSDPPTVAAGGLAGSPASTVTDTTRPELAWSYTDPQRDSQTAWQLLVFNQPFVDAHNMADPLRWVSQALMAQEGNQRTARGVTPSIDFPNGSYRMYVRAQDTAGQWSAWSSRGWTQAVTAPTTPTGLTATADNATFSVALSLQATSGNNADLVRFECSDDGGQTWAPVRGATAVPLQPTTAATDWDIPLGRLRLYRATAYSNEPRVSSAPSGVAAATVTRLVHVLTAVDDPALGGEVHAVDPAEWTRPVDAGVFEGLGAEFATVVSGGRPRSRRTTLHINPQNRAQWEQLQALAESDSVLLHRDPFGDAVYCRLVGDWRRVQIPAARLAGEVTPLRHLHSSDLPLVEVAPPQLATAAAF